MSSKTANKAANTKRVTMISKEAKKIRKDKPSLKWTSAIKQASASLKKQGKL